MKVLLKLEKSKEFWFLFITSFCFIILRLPSLFEPLWYGDEGIYEVIGLALHNGRLLYRDIWDNKPPLLYLVYAIFQQNQSVIRFVSLLAGIISLFLFYFLAKKIFTTFSIVSIITGMFALLLATPIIEGNIANAENFMMPFILGAGLLTLNISNSYSLKDSKTKKKSFNYIQSTRYLLLVIAGLILGIGFLIKVVAVFDLGAFTFFLAFLQIPSSTPLRGQSWFVVVLKCFFPELILLYISFLTPFIFTILFFILNNALGDFIHSAFLSNIEYVNYNNIFYLPGGIQVPQGILLFKLLILGLVGYGLFRKRAQIAPMQMFIFMWFVFSLFSTLFSQRPYTHYLLILLGSFCLFFGLILQKTKKQSLYIGFVFLIVMYFLSTFPIYTKTFGYYQNFIGFISGKETITTFRAFFDKSTPRDYALAQFLTNNMNSKDHLFVWGNNAQLYVLTHKLPPGRYTVAYHITASDNTMNETRQALMKVKPKYIVIMPNQETMPYSLIGYSQRLSYDNAIIYERDF